MIFRDSASSSVHGAVGGTYLRRISVLSSEPEAVSFGGTGHLLALQKVILAASPWPQSSASRKRVRMWKFWYLAGSLGLLDSESPDGLRTGAKK